MASAVFDFKELDEFSSALLDNGMRDNPSRTRKFLNQQGYALRKKTREIAKQKVKKRTGKYHKGFRKGKVYNFKGDKTVLAVRVYNATAGAGAIERGRKYTKDGKEYFKPGAHVMETAQQEFEPEYRSALDDLLDEFVNSI